ncbi:MAG TPA: hypothetical protein DEO36_06835 [Flavobacteriaceae bacterium]|jgi:hypothetical protein|nr:hypothetical protein [Flavobacteriaceae bacterium]
MKNIINLLLMLTVFILLLNCEKEENFETNILQEGTIESPDYIFDLGKKLENPYTVKNMQKAYQNLLSNKNSNFTKTGASKIQTTHYYVRFLPKDDIEKEVLQDKDELMLFDMPLDYELEEGVGGAYHDPSISEGKITWQYTVVSLDYQFRNIKYEKLADLFLQDDEDEKGNIKNKLSTDFWYELEDEALRITGNQDDDDSEDSNIVYRRRKWYPSGRIIYEDNTTATSRNIPLQGAKIIVKRWFKWKSAITDVNGNFRVGKFRSKKVKCAIKWERKDWDIRSGSYGQAWYSFESLRRGSNWNITIRESSTPRNWLYASIHRGALHYFYSYNTYGIRKPYNKWIFLKRRLHLGAKYKRGRAHYFDFNKAWWSSPVAIYSQGNNGTVYDSRELFATTIHELAHVSHWEIGYSTGQYVIDALADDPFLPESWAVGVEHTITNRVYSATIVGANNFPLDFDRQDWTLREIQTSSEGYTPIVIDMIDDINQSTTRIGGTIDNNRPNDRVSGYSLSELEDALPSSLGSWWTWRTKIREKYNNPTEGDALDYLFREYR